MLKKLQEPKHWAGNKVWPQKKLVQNPNPVIVFTAWQSLNKKTIKYWPVFPHKRIQ